MKYAALALLLSAAPAVAAQCGPTDQVRDLLMDTYGETRQGIGMGPNNVFVEIWASLDTGTWTITTSTADGVTCLVASGEGYEALNEPPGTLN